jgi:protein subunit release factor B
MSKETTNNETAPSQHPASLEIEALLEACEVRRGRRSGPGGQHRNKVETAVVITHLPTLITGEATERRSQQQNRAVAITRLRINLALKLRTAANAMPSELWRSRCRGRRISVSADHDDFPALLAEALNAIETQESVADAAQSLRITSSQLVKLLKIDRRGLQLVNASRVARGERALK